MGPKKYVFLAVGLFLVMTSQCDAQESAPHQHESVTQDPIILGVSLGPVIPFAVYMSGRWTNVWPKLDINEAARQEHSPAELAELLVRTLGDDGRLPNHWWFLPFSGKPKSVEVLEIFWLETHCTWSWALRTETPKVPPQCKHCCPDARIGIVSNRRCFASQFKPLAPDSLTAERLLAGLRDDLELEETRRITEDAAASGSTDEGRLDSGHLLDAEARHGLAFERASIWQAALSERGHTLYYIRGARNYEKPEASYDSGCPAVSVFSAWARENKEGDLTLLDLGVALTDCEHKGASSYRPITTLAMDGDEYVVLEIDHWEGLEYAVLEVGSRRMTTQVSSWTSF